MTSLRNFRLPFIGIGLLLATCGLGHASLVCSTPGVCYSTASLPLADTEVQNYSLVLDKFDSSLGTLTGVTLYYQATETVSSFKIKNNSASSSGSFNATISSYVNSGGDNTANSNDAFGLMSVVLFATLAPYCGPSIQPHACHSLSLAAGGSTADYGPFTVNLTDAVYGFTSGTGAGGTLGVTQAGTPVGVNFSTADYIKSGGSSTFNLTGSTIVSLNFIGGGGNLAVLQSTKAAFTAEVDYAYTAAAPAPEPATMGLIGGALIGLVALRKRFAR